MDASILGGPSDVSDAGRHTPNAFRCSGRWARDDESDDTGYCGTESADELITFATASPYSSPNPSLTSTLQHVYCTEADFEDSAEQFYGNCEQSIQDPREDCGVVNEKDATTKHREVLQREVEHQEHDHRAKSPTDICGEKSAHRFETTAIERQQESLSSSGKKTDVRGTKKSSLIQKSNKSTGNAQQDISGSRDFVIAHAAVEPEDIENVCEELVADHEHTPTPLSSGPGDHLSKSVFTATPVKAEDRVAGEGNAQENMPKPPMSRVSSETFVSDMTSSTAVSVTPVLECTKKQEVQELQTLAMVSSCSAKKRKLSCTDLQGGSAITPSSANDAIPCSVVKAFTKRLMTQTDVSNWPGGISSTAERQPACNRMGRVYAKARHAPGAKANKTSTSVPVLVSLQRTKNVPSPQQNSAATLRTLDDQKPYLTSVGGVLEKVATRQQIGELATHDHHERLPLPRNEDQSDGSAHRSETSLPSAPVACGSTQPVGKQETRRIVMTPSSRMNRARRLPVAGDEHKRHAGGHCFPRIRTLHGFRMRELYGVEGPGCSRWSTNAFHADPRSTVRLSANSEKAGRHSRAATTGEAGRRNRMEYSQLNQRPRTRREPFFSEDPKENHDNHNPGWESFRQLSSDKERYEAVRRVWQNVTIPDPHCNLTQYYYLYRLRRYASLTEVVGSKHKRKASGSCDGERPAKRKRMDTEVYDLRVEQLRRKTEESMYAARFALETKLQRLREELQRHKVKESNGKRLKRQRSSTAPSDISVWRQREEKLQTSFRTQTEHIHIRFTSEIGKLLHARKEVRHFDKFYSGLIDSDPTMLSDSQMQEQLNIEKMLEHFKGVYSEADPALQR